MSDCGGNCGGACCEQTPMSQLGTVFGINAGGMRRFTPARGLPNGSGNWVGFQRADQGGIAATGGQVVTTGKSLAGAHVYQVQRTDDGGMVSLMGIPAGAQDWLIAASPSDVHVGFNAPPGRPH
jgi:hypothetical protein